MRSNRLRRLSTAALFAALLCILSPLSLPLGPIPVSLGLLGLLLAALMLSPGMTLATVATFLALGAVGLPVFAGGLGGLQALLGPTGGYLWGYLPAGLLGAALTPQGGRHTPLRLFASGLSMLTVVYGTGTLQYCIVTASPPLLSLSVTLLPFLLPDLCKLTAAVVLSKQLQKHAKLEA